MKDIITIEKNGNCFSFNKTGTVSVFTMKGIQLSKYINNALEEGTTGFYLRRYNGNTIQEVVPLINPKTPCSISRSEQSISFENDLCKIIFTAFPNGGRWDVNIKEEKDYDIVYLQDLSLMEKTGALENELYASQYLGNTIFKEESGYIVSSRQNLASGGRTPAVQIGSLNHEIIHYATDAMQILTTKYKRDAVPTGLFKDLEDKNLQGECTLIALQSRRYHENRTLGFYFYFTEDMKEPITKPIEKTIITKEFIVKETPLSPIESIHIKEEFGCPISADSLDAGNIQKLFPSRKLEEFSEGKLFSFFTPYNSHVVNIEKELKSERNTATILTSFIDTEHISEELISTTSAMGGIFMSHVVTGNTNLNKVISSARGLLGEVRNSGLRIHVKIDGKYHQLLNPSLFEMGQSYAIWYYFIKDKSIKVTVFTAKDTPSLQLQLEASFKTDFLVSAALTAGAHEELHEVITEVHQNFIIVKPGDEELCKKTYPELSYRFHISEGGHISDDRVFFSDGKSHTVDILTITYPSASSFTIKIDGKCVSEDFNSPKFLVFEDEKELYLTAFSELLNGFKVHTENPEEKEHADIINETAYIYMHNALIHFAMPHGLEQQGGAAWGTRDISQGPFELFMTFGKFNLVREILLNIFSHQKTSGEWPQWFMFDRYKMYQESSHGDVVFWPLKCLAEYIKATEDLSILDEKLPYLDTQKVEPLSAHLNAALASINGRFVLSTHLISYAGGDWDDTLQPAKEEDKKKLISAWTQALAYECISKLAVIPSLKEECLALAGKIKEDFRRYLIIDGVIAGFVRICDDNTFKPLLHPSDNESGIHLRLLPLTRSIISGIIDEEQALKNEQLIEEKLHHPDGVRLMDSPAPYNGGNCTLFKRAEQAANVGREISLQYTHAHIRYIEAMCTLNNSRMAYESLFEINPILIQHTVPNAMLRQSNMYFSSSDGAFMDRYEYAENFALLSEGRISVKGGWRLYSSGSGIYLHNMISNIIGLDIGKKKITIKPCLPEYLLPLSVTFSINGEEIIVEYSKSQDKDMHILQDGIELNVQKIPYAYQKEAVSLNIDQINSKKKLEVKF